MTNQRDRNAPIVSERAKKAGDGTRKALKFALMCLLFTATVMIAEAGQQTQLGIAAVCVVIGYCLAKL